MTISDIRKSLEPRSPGELAQLLATCFSNIEGDQVLIAELLALLNERLDGAKPPAPPDPPPAPEKAERRNVGKRHLFRDADEKAAVIEHSIAHGVTAAAEHFGVPAGTIYGWRKVLGISPNCVAPTPARNHFDPQAARDAAAESAFPDSFTKGDNRAASSRSRPRRPNRAFDVEIS